MGVDSYVSGLVIKSGEFEASSGRTVRVSVEEELLSDEHLGRLHCKMDVACFAVVDPVIGWVEFFNCYRIIRDGLTFFMRNLHVLHIDRVFRKYDLIASKCVTPAIN